jgi:ankyrin repeat protein
MKRQKINLLLLAVLSLGAALNPGVAAQDRSVNEKLFASIRDADPKSLKAMLSRGADVSARDEDGLTPLMYAAMYAGADCMGPLLEKGADPNAKSNSGVTALMLAIRHPEKVKLLLSRGADINAKSDEGHTALSIAAASGAPVEVVRMLLDEGADLKVGNVLGAAARIGDIRVVKLLLERGADPNDRRDLFGTHLISPKRSSDVSKMHGSPIISPILGVPGLANNGGTPLMYAAHARNREVVKLLIASGADVKARHNDSGGALLPAAQLGDSGVVKLLLENGAEVNARHASGYTALMYAAASESNDPEMIKALLASGAEVGVKAKDGETALSLARRKGNTEIVRLLERAAANE